MNRKVWLTVLLSMCFLSAISLSQFMVSVRASPYTNMSVSVAKEMIDTNPDLVILDVRYQYEYDSGHIKNAILIPLPELEGRIGELGKEKETLVYCKLGGRSATASEILDANGFTKVYNMQGGITAWISAGYPIEILFNVILEEKTYTVATFSNSTVSGFNFSQPLKQISFDVAGSDGTVGFCNVTVSNVLLGGPYTVLVNNQLPAVLLETSNGTHTFLYFSYFHSTHKVQIVGTRVGPPPPPPAVGGIAAPIAKPKSPNSSNETVLITILLLAVTVVFVKFRKKEKEGKELTG
ncbi:MAG: rhodanese-like domain-containing protein [Candidatus Bathyarchaeaceae archaeon]